MHGLPVHRQPLAKAERIEGTSPPVVHEHRVGTDRDVVQEETPIRTPDVDAALDSVESSERAERVGSVEAEIAREMVPRADRHADERQVARDRSLGHGCERAVAAGNAEYVGLGLARERRGVLAFAEDVGLDAPGGCRGEQVLDAGIRAGTRIHQEPAAQRVPNGTSRYDVKRWAERLMTPPGPASII